VERLDHNSHALLSYSSVRSQSPVIVINLAEIASYYTGLLITKKSTLIEVRIFVQDNYR
jgi:hypothetical protein